MNTFFYSLLSLFSFLSLVNFITPSVLCSDQKERGRIFYQKKRGPKRTIKTIVEQFSDFELPKHAPVFILSADHCKNRVNIRWFHPLIVCMSAEGTEAYSFMYTDERTEKRIKPECQMELGIQKLCALLLSGHDIIFPYPREKDKNSYVFFFKMQSPKYYDETGKQKVFQTVGPKNFIDEFSFEFQKKIYQLQTFARSTQVVDSYNPSRAESMIVDEGATQALLETAEKYQIRLPKRDPKKYHTQKEEIEEQEKKQSSKGRNTALLAGGLGLLGTSLGGLLAFSKRCKKGASKSSKGDKKLSSTKSEKNTPSKVKPSASRH